MGVIPWIWKTGVIRTNDAKKIITIGCFRQLPPMIYRKSSNLSLCIFSCRDFHADHFSSLEHITYSDHWGRNRKIIENALFRAKLHDMSVWRRSIAQTSFELSCYYLNRREGSRRSEKNRIGLDLSVFLLARASGFGFSSSECSFHNFLNPNSRLAR
jgi:hypothetical protein